MIKSIRLISIITLFVPIFFINCNKDKPNTSSNIPNKVITIESLQSMFSNIENKNKWNTKKPLLWGYFFTHHEPKLLEKAKIELANKGYNFVDIFLSDKESSNDPDLWWLHVEKEEIHTPESLDKLNDEFYIFADKFGLDSYDGMDAGPIIKK